MNKIAYFYMIIWLVILSGCWSTTKFKTHPTIPSTPSNYFYYGGSEVDITPPPGYPMGGFGSEGRISRGVWTPLKVKSNYFRDKKGASFALVSCDLWSMPMGLSLRVGEILQKSATKDHHLGTAQILLSATHTHHSHAGFSTSDGYNSLAAPIAGFDKKLFEWMAQKIASAITHSIDNIQPVVMARWSHSIEGLIRNRSIEAFQKTAAADQQDIVSNVHQADQYYPDLRLPSFVKSKKEFEALDPFNTSLIFYPLGATVGDPIAMINFCSFHPTVMGTGNELYSRDVFAIVENSIKKKMGWWNTTISFINGSEGDISCNWFEQDMYNTRRIGLAMADSILSPARTSVPLTGDVSLAYNIVPMTDQVVSIPLTGDYPACFDQLDKRTASDPFPGIGSVGGAEDGRTDLYHKGLMEGMRSENCQPGHGNKAIALKHAVKAMFAALPPLTYPALEYVFKKTITKTAPREVPLGVHSIGNISIVSLPGEITTALGYQIRKQVSQQLGYPDYHQVLIAGLTNEYLSYFTTPAEYGAQHYEGASTMYGFMAGSYLRQEAGKLVQTPVSPLKKEYKFKPGKNLKLNPEISFKNETWNVEEGLSTYMVNGDNGDNFNHFPIFHFEEAGTFALSTDINTKYYPVVALEYLNPTSNTWTNYLLEKQSTQFIKFIQKVINGKNQWGIMWMPSLSVNLPNQLRFKVITPDNKTMYSQSFNANDILSRRSGRSVDIAP